MATKRGCTGLSCLVTSSYLLLYSVILGTPGCLLDQLSPEQQHAAEDQEDHGFTDDSWFPSDNTLEKESTVVESHAKRNDVGLCQAIEKTFLDLSKVAVVKQQNGESCWNIFYYLLLRLGSFCRQAWCTIGARLAPHEVQTRVARHLASYGCVSQRLGLMPHWCNDSFTEK